MKKCSKCKKWKDVDDFYKNKNKSDGLNNYCKTCSKSYGKYYRELYKDYYNNYMKEWRQKNEHKHKNYVKEYIYKNKNILYADMKKRRDLPISFLSNSKYRKEIELYEEVKESSNGNLMCKCAYCGEWFEPTIIQVGNRIASIYGRRGYGSEQRFYCSQSCKDNCPVYNQVLYSKGQKPATSREVQPELRQMVFERDNYTCQKCSIHKNKLDVGIQCHHKEGILWEPIESADMDMCITLCENCHKEVHGIDGCGYSEMKCA